MKDNPKSIQYFEARWFQNSVRVCVCVKDRCIVWQIEDVTGNLEILCRHDSDDVNWLAPRLRPQSNKTTTTCPQYLPHADVLYHILNHHSICNSKRIKPILGECSSGAGEYCIKIFKSLQGRKVLQLEIKITHQTLTLMLFHRAAKPRGLQEG